MSWPSSVLTPETQVNKETTSAALPSSVVLSLKAPRPLSSSFTAPWAMSLPCDRIATLSHTCSTS